MSGWRPVLCALALVCAGPACTVAPSRVEAAGASYDGGEANSGVLSLEQTGAVVTPRLVGRYRALLDVYRKAFVPRVDPQAGIAARPDGTFFITNEVLERLILLTGWHRAARKPE